MKKILAVSAVVLLATGFASAWPALMEFGNGWNETQVQAMQRMMQGQLLQSDVPVINAAMKQTAADSGNWDDMPCHQSGSNSVGTTGMQGMMAAMGSQDMQSMHKAMHGE